MHRVVPCVVLLVACSSKAEHAAPTPPPPSPPSSIARVPDPEPPGPPPPAGSPYACAADQDCVVVGQGCCGCEGGASAVAIRADAAETYRAESRAHCTGTCPQYPPERQALPCHMRAACRGGSCTLVPRTALPPGPVRADCKVDSDCAMVNDGCCGCGGKVARADVATALVETMVAHCATVSCPAVIDERPICRATAVCVNGTCAPKLPDDAPAPGR